MLRSETRPRVEHSWIDINLRLVSICTENLLVDDGIITKRISTAYGKVCWGRVLESRLPVRNVPQSGLGVGLVMF